MLVFSVLFLVAGQCFAVDLAPGGPGGMGGDVGGGSGGGGQCNPPPTPPDDYSPLPCGNGTPKLILQQCVKGSGTYKIVDGCEPFVRQYSSKVPCSDFTPWGGNALIEGREFQDLCPGEKLCQQDKMRVVDKLGVTSNPVDITAYKDPYYCIAGDWIITSDFGEYHVTRGDECLSMMIGINPGAGDPCFGFGYSQVNYIKQIIKKDFEKNLGSRLHHDNLHGNS